MLDSNYSLNTVDICPVGALTSTDFRFKMRVWFLKETKTIDVNCGTGCEHHHRLARERDLPHHAAREQRRERSVWLPDSHRLNFKYVGDERRLKMPTGERAAGRLAHRDRDRRGDAQSAGQRTDRLARLGRMTNEELFLAARLVDALDIEKQHDIVPRTGEADGLLIAADRNPNTTGASLLGLCAAKPGVASEERSPKACAAARFKALISLGEDATKAGLDRREISQKLDALIALDILPNKTTPHATVLLPGERLGGKARLDDQSQRPPPAPQPRGRRARPGARRLGNPARSDPGDHRLERLLHDRRRLQTNGRGQ